MLVYLVYIGVGKVVFVFVRFVFVNIEKVFIDKVAAIIVATVVRIIFIMFFGRIYKVLFVGYEK